MYCTYLANGVMCPDIGQGQTVSVRAKYLLIKLIQLFGLDLQIEDSFEVLGKEVGVSGRLAKEAFQFLVSHGYLIDEAEMDGFDNRLAGRYQVSHSSLLLLQPLTTNSRGELHRILIDELLQKDTSVNYDNRRHPLKLASRLLLVVLLSRADECGVVRNLGKNDLCRLTGLNRTRLDTHLGRLLERGYIRSIVPGGTGMRIFGKVAGVYFLNLQHENFKNIARVGYVYLITAKSELVENEFREARQLLEWARQYVYSDFPFAERNEWIQVRRTPGQPDTSRIRCGMHSGAIVEFFTASEFTGIESYLQTKFDEYASYLLSHFWNDLLRQMDLENILLRDRIREDFLPPKFRGMEKDGVFPSDYQKDLLVEVIFGIAWKMAQSIAKILNKYSDGSFTQMNLRILPVQNISETGLSFAVEAFPKSSTEGWSQCVSITQNANMNDWLCDPLLAENELSLDQRIQVGLRSNVKLRDVRLKTKFE